MKFPLTRFAYEIAYKVVRLDFKLDMVIRGYLEK